MTTLKERYETLKAEQPSMRARNMAAELNVSEGELLACRVGEAAIRLQDEFEAILKEIEPLGEVMALTRNEACVHERKGVYANASFAQHGPMKHGLFVNPDIDLRLFMNHWSSAFAVHEETKSGMRKSIQFFDKAGDAIHKIYLTAKSDEAAFDALVEKYTAAEQPSTLEVETYPAKAADSDDSEVDWDAFRNAWSKLKDTHDFYPLLRKFKVGRTQALRHAGDNFAYRVENNASRQILDLARDENCEIMVFVGNRGCIQIHTGPVNKLLEHGSWYNVMDPKFNLHLNEEMIGETWVTKKPTEDGHVTAIEVFDANGEIIVTFFGKRKPGIPELTLWREIVSRIPASEVANAA